MFGVAFGAFAIYWLIKKNPANARNIIMSSNIILSKNIVPFYKASLISGFLIVIFLFVFFQFTKFGILNLVIVPLVIDLFYQGWKWPMEVIYDLKITYKDYQSFIKDLFFKPTN